jgi:hypothetical protein
LKRIIFTPGKNIKPPGGLHKQQLLRCLLHSVGKLDADVADEIEKTQAFSMVAWNSTFYEETRDISRDVPWVDRLLEMDAPAPADISAARPLAYRVAKLIYQIGDTMPWLIPLIPDERDRTSIRDTERYFKNHDNIACRVRDLQKAPLREAYAKQDKILLIGHSMGSVIAYDALWELDHLEDMHECVDCFLTIGSPLGMKFVQKRLINHENNHPDPYPGNIRKWINVSARGDLVALDPRVANDFGDMVKQDYIESIEDRVKGVYNFYRDDKGLNVHKSYGYMANPEVAGVITDWWKAA